MDLFDAINSRYSYRGRFTGEKVSEEDMRKILNAGIAAPSGMHINTTSFVAVTDENLISQLGRLIPGNGLSTASFVIVALTESKNAGSMNFEIENYSAAIENILLAVTALGYGTVWTDGVCRFSKINNGIREILKIPAHKKIKCVLPIGRPANVELPKTKDKIEDVVVFNGY